MRAIKVDTRAIDMMKARGKTYESLSMALKTQGIELRAATLHRYITHKEVPNKSVKKAIAKALNCTVIEIF